MPDRAGRIPRQASPVVARPFIYRLVRRSIELLGVHRLNDTEPAPGGVPGVAPKCCSGVGLDREQCHPGSGTDSEGTDQPPGRIQWPLTIAGGPFIGVRSYPGTLPTSDDSRSVVKTDCVSYSHQDHRGGDSKHSWVWAADSATRCRQRLGSHFGSRGSGTTKSAVKRL